MNSGQIIIILLAFAFSGALPAFIFAARQNGWPVGSLFLESKKTPVFVAIACVSVLSGGLLSSIIHGEISILWPLWGVLAFIVGGSIILKVFKSWSGMVSLVAAPIFSVISIFFNL